MSTLKYLFLLFSVVLISACVPKEEKASNQEATSVVEISAIYDSENDMHLFKTDADTIPSGWTTFKFNNASPAMHFAVLELMPVGRTSEDSKKEVFQPFNEAMMLIKEGKREEGLGKLANLPDWFAEVTFTGGPGFTSPGKSTETIVYLEPGNYVMECYVKTEEGSFHSTMGMIRDLVVTTDSSEVSEPSEPTIEIDLSNDGIVVNGETTSGRHLVAVHFNEDAPPLLGNDIQVVRLGKGDSIDSVAAWMDWSQPNGLVSTPEKPAPAVFLGGTHELPKGETAYFYVDLSPGEYAWISERPADSPLYKRFTVAAEQISAK